MFISAAKLAVLLHTLRKPTIAGVSVFNVLAVCNTLFYTLLVFEYIFRTDPFTQSKSDYQVIPNTEPDMGLFGRRFINETGLKFFEYHRVFGMSVFHLLANYTLMFGLFFVQQYYLDWFTVAEFLSMVLPLSVIVHVVAMRCGVIVTTPYMTAFMNSAILRTFTAIQAVYPFRGVLMAGFYSGDFNAIAATSNNTIVAYPQGNYINGVEYRYDAM
ncbi:MAG: hypothetical protein Faunusvirus18_13 [Faunusvirus sp.]|jgi:hypothetical protein|uniref:Uncharacterized protein n=1 Tax=Faunusvirus sp. TaxID=2487766 RepID=A0A3G4ZX62_9VIRU|nr:MAG: hypothetical protein Faunusvirus18_13 [Faunusvirus sp.]